MSETKTKAGRAKAIHTPGPWEAYGSEIFKAGTDWACIALACNPRPQSGDSADGPERLRIGNSRFYEGCANAQLIASAPRLLAACLAMLAHRECPIHSPEGREMRAAVDQAIGEATDEST